MEVMVHSFILFFLVQTFFRFPEWICMIRYISYNLRVFLHIQVMVRGVLAAAKLSNRFQYFECHKSAFFS